MTRIATIDPQIQKLSPEDLASPWFDEAVSVQTKFLRDHLDA